MVDMAIVVVNDSGIKFAYRIGRNVYKKCRINRDIKLLEISRNIQTERKCKDFINESNDITIMFFAHGSEDTIDGFGGNKLIQYPRNHDILKGIKVFCFSCSSARKLGKKAVEENYAKVFLGFDKDITWNNCSEEYFKTYLGQIISKVLVNAVNEFSNFKKLKQVIEYELINNINKDLIPGIKIKPEVLKNIYNMIGSICLIGNDTETV